MDVIQQLENELKQQGISNAELARRLDVSATAVSKWFCGRTTPTLDHIVCIAMELGGSIEFNKEQNK